MPLNCEIDPELKLVTVVAKGAVTLADFDGVLDAIRNAGAHGYRKLFDGGRGEARMTPEDATALGVRMRVEHGKSPMGPMAVVLSEKYGQQAARVLGMLAAADRPMRIFNGTAAARRWLRSMSEWPAARSTARRRRAAPIELDQG